MMINDLSEWAVACLVVDAPDVAKLLMTAADKIKAGETDVELAAKLLECAATQDYVRKQQTLAQLMADAAEALQKRSAA